MSPQEQIQAIINEAQNKKLIDSYRSEKALERSKNAYEGRILQNKVRRRIQRIKNDPTASIFSATSYDNWKAMYDKGPSWEKSTPERVAQLKRTLQEIDNNQTSRLEGARAHHEKSASLMGKSYTDLTRTQQSNMWNEFEAIRSRHKNLESDQIASLVKYGVEKKRQLVEGDDKDSVENPDYKIVYDTDDKNKRYPRIEIIAKDLSQKKQKQILDQTRKEWAAVKRSLD